MMVKHAYNTISSFSCFFTFIHKIKHLSSWENENSKYDVMEVYVHTTVRILQKENKKFSSLGNKFTCSIKLFFIIVKNEYYLYYMFFVCALHQVIWCCLRAIAQYLFFFNILCYNQKYIHVPISKRHTVHNLIVCAV